MSRARAGVAESNFALGGPVSSKVNLWVFKEYENFIELFYMSFYLSFKKRFKIILSLNAQASAQAADGTLGAQADASYVKVDVKLWWYILWRI